MKVRYTLDFDGGPKPTKAELPDLHAYLVKCAVACEPKGLPVLWNGKALVQEVLEGDGVEVVLKGIEGLK